MKPKAIHTRRIPCLTLLFVCLFPMLTSQLAAQQVLSGLEVLEKNNFEILKGKRVGLITNPTGVNRQLQSTVDILHNHPNVNLVALFGPEHGIRGNFPAGKYVPDYIDERTGLKVYSVYGKTRKPTPEMLQGLDLLVYDIQDIGSRSYTYISTMGLAMEACAENNVEFMVLDRPNPLGGNRIEGSVVEKDYVSFVSQFAIPYVYGLTCGELAQLLNREKMLENGVQCKLTVIQMEGWNRNMLFADTGLPWVPTSPHIPHAQNALYYPTSGILGELYTVSIGVGYPQPFELFAAEWIDAERLADSLNGLQLPGVIFRPVHIRPYYSVGKGTELHGVQHYITQPDKAPLSLIQFYVLQECYKLYPSHNVFEECDPSRLSMFDKVSGSNKVRELFSQRFLVKDLLPYWQKDVKRFRKVAKKYYLYE